MKVPPGEYDFSNRSDGCLIEWWNEREGTITWLTAIETELERRGYQPRDEAGTRRTIPIPGNKK